MSGYDLDQGMQALLPESIRSATAYQVADAKGMIKLDAMENPYGWTQKLKQQWLEKLAEVEINRYPDPQGSGIQKRLRAKYELTQQQGLVLGNGSDELIQLLIMAVAASGRPIMAPAPSFVMYKIIAEYLNVSYVGVPLKEDFSLDEAGMLAEIKAHRPAIVFIASPNNPTANLFSDDALEAIIQASEGLVVIDEAYIAFTKRDQMHWLKQYSNVLIMRTFSKMGLAGLRLGFLIGHRAWIEAFDKLRLPYNINSLTQLSVEFALDHYSVLEEQSRLLCEQREALISGLNDLKVFECYPSEANFIILRCKEDNARQLYEGLIDKGILIKCLDGSHPLLEQCLRITVGKPEDNLALLSTLHQLI